MESENARESPSWLRKDNLKKNSTITLIGLALLIISNTALNVKMTKKGTNFSLCHNFTLPYDIQPSSLFSIGEDINVTKEAFMDNYLRCLPEHVLHLGEDIYLDVCNYNASIRVDIGRYTSTVEGEGISPTIRGIYLSPDQWKVLKVKRKFVDRAIKRANFSLN